MGEEEFLLSPGFSLLASGVYVLGHPPSAACWGHKESDLVSALEEISI